MENVLKLNIIFTLINMLTAIITIIGPLIMKPNAYEHILNSQYLVSSICTFALFGKNRQFLVNKIMSCHCIKWNSKVTAQFPAVQEERRLSRSQTVKLKSNVVIN